MNNAQTAVLAQLQTTNPVSGNGLIAWSLSYRTGFPEPSVRRTIAELRSMGHDIRTGRNGYILHPTTTTSKGRRGARV